MTDLINACDYHNVDEVKFILENRDKINPNLQDNYGYTALIYASYKGYTEIVKLLLQYKNYSEKINPNLQNDCNITAIIYASYHSYTEIVKLLLNYENYSERININLQIYHITDKEIAKLSKDYNYFVKNIDIFIPSYNILLFILISNKCTCTSIKAFIYIPNEIILLIKKYGEEICGKNLY